MKRSARTSVSQQIPLLIVVLIFLVAAAPDVFHQGMKLDGVIYATLSKNLAAGVGEVWKLHYTDTHFPEFYEHPPFGIWVQSLFFRFFGDGIFTEKLHSLVNLFALLIVYVATWRRFLDPRLFDPSPYQSTYRNRYWLPVLALLSMPVILKSFTNNFLENLLSVVCAAAVYMQVLAVTSSRISAFSLVALAAFLTILACLTKGPVGLFPAATIPILAIVIGLRKPMILLGVVYLLVLLVLGAAIVQDENASMFLKRYYDAQLVTSLGGVRQIDHGRMYLLTTVFSSLAVPCALALIAWLFAGAPRKGICSHLFYKGTVFALLIALAASLPLMISPRQYKHYLVPALPYYAIFLSLVFLPLLDALRERATNWASSKFQNMALRLLGISLTAALMIQGVLWFAEIDHDRKYLDVANYFSSSNIRSKRVYIVGAAGGLDQFESYLARYADISLVRNCQNAACADYLIVLHGEASGLPGFKNKVEHFSQFSVWSK